MVAHAYDSVLNESSTSILKFLLEQRVTIEREMNDRLSLLIEDIPKTDQSFDSFMLFLAKEARYHTDLANSLYNLTGPSVAGDECLMKTIDYLKTFYSVACVELQALQSQILSALQNSRALNSSSETPISIESPKNITSTSLTLNGVSPASVGGPNSSAELSGFMNISTTSSTATIRNNDQAPKDAAPPPPLSVPAIKPPSEVASSGHKPWFGRRRKKKPDTSAKKQSPREKSPQDKKEEFEDVTAEVPQVPGVVDSDGYSIRPEIANDDLDNFYSSSDEEGTTAVGENEALESTQPIKFQIRPISEADLRAKTPLNDKASTEELRDMALNLVIPERPIKRGLIRGGHLNAADPKLRNTVDVSDMLGLKPSISQKSLNSDCSGISDHSGSLPPPAKPPPKTFESQSATSSTASILSPQSLTVPGKQNANTPGDSRLTTSSGAGFNADFNASFKSQTSSSSVTPTPPALPARKPPQTSATLARPLSSIPVPPPRPTPSVPPKNAQPTNSSASNVSSSSTIPFQTPPALPPKLPPRRQSITSLSGSGVFERVPSVPSRPARAESLDVKMDPFGAKSATIALGSGVMSRQDSCSSTTSATCNLGPGDQLSSGFELPLSFSFHEKISAIIKSEDIASSTVQILGSLNLMFPAENVEKIINSKLGKICFEVPELMAFKECIQINCLQPLVEVREKEAVDDPVVYEIEPSSLVEYIETKPQMNSYHIKLIQYQIKVDKQTDCVEESMHLAPLQIMSYCKTVEDDKVINVKVEYMYNEGAFSGSHDNGNQQPPLLETAVLARVVQPNSKSPESLLNGGVSNPRQVESVNTEPEALWDNENNQVIWHLGTVSPSSGPNQAKGAGVLKAKFALKSPLVLDSAPSSGIESDLNLTEKLATARSDLSPDELNASLTICQDEKSKTIKAAKREKIVAVGARFRCEGSVTGINVKLADNESNNYKLSPVIHNTSTGQYISLTV